MGRFQFRTFSRNSRAPFITLLLLKKFGHWTRTRPRKLSARIFADVRVKVENSSISLGDEKLWSVTSNINMSRTVASDMHAVYEAIKSLRLSYVAHYTRSARSVDDIAMCSCKSVVILVIVCAVSASSKKYVSDADDNGRSVLNKAVKDCLRAKARYVQSFFL